MSPRARRTLEQEVRHLEGMVQRAAGRLRRSPGVYLMRLEGRLERARRARARELEAEAGRSAEGERVRAAGAAGRAEAAPFGSGEPPRSAVEREAAGLAASEAVGEFLAAGAALMDHAGAVGAEDARFVSEMLGCLETWWGPVEFEDGPGEAA